MNLIKSLRERKAVTLFFILSFTAGILIFSIGNSAIVSQQKVAEQFNPNNNKILTFINYEGVTLKEVSDIIKNQNVTLLIQVVEEESRTGIQTMFLPEGEELRVDMKAGSILSKEELKGNGSNAIYSSRINEELEVNSIKLNKVGAYYEKMRRIIISNGLFMNLYGDREVLGTEVILRGEPNNIKNSIKALEVGLKNKNIKNGVEYFDLIIDDKGMEAKALYNVAALIFIITIINALSISALWVKNRKKEIVLRKVLGAKNIDIAKIFFGELLIIAILSFVIALIIQYVIAQTSTTGFIFNVDIRLNMKTLTKSFMIAIISSFTVALTSLKYISKIQLAEMLKGE